MVNSANPAWRRSCPTPWSEWSPTERFVSGSAPAGATRPFVDVQSVSLSRRSFVDTTTGIAEKSIQQPIQTAAGQGGTANSQYKFIHLTYGGVLVEGLGSTGAMTTRPCKLFRPRRWQWGKGFPERNDSFDAPVGSQLDKCFTPCPDGSIRADYCSTNACAV